MPQCSRACVLLLTVLVCAAPAVADTPAAFPPAFGDTLVAGVIGEPSALLPLLAADSASHDVAAQIYPGLLKYGTDLTLQPALARSWEVSPDGLTITFHLRDDVVWEDGVPFTAHDVRFGFDTIIDPATPTAYAEDFRQVQSFEIRDNQTFSVHYAQPFAPALGSWGNLVVLPRHLLEGPDITRNRLIRHPVGLGPFRFSRWVAGQQLVLEANPRYFTGRPYLDRYIYRFIPDPATLFMELQAGSIDMMSLTPLQYQRQTDSAVFRDNFRKFRFPTFSYTYLGFNLRHPWFGDARLRQAIACAIDRNELIKGVLLGLGRPATGPYVPGTWPYNPDVRQWEYDPRTAQQLLDAAGWIDADGDGIRERDGQPLSFTVITNMGNQLRMNTATIIQWRLRQVGIDMAIRVLEWSTMLNEFVDRHRFEAVLLGWSIGLDPDQYDIWHSSKTGSKQLNFIGYENPEVDDLLERGRRIFDQIERKRVYDRLQEILARDVPYVFLYVPDALPIVHRRFHNIRPSPIGIRYNIESWYVPAAQQRHRLKP